MFLLNEININLGIFKITNGFQLAEVILLFFIIIIQLIITFRTLRKISVFKSIFNDRLNVKTGFIEKRDLKNNNHLISKIHFKTEYDDDTWEQKFSSRKFKKIAIIQGSDHNKILLKIKNALNQYLIRNYAAVVNFSLIKDIVEREVENKDEEISNSLPTPLYLGLGATMVGIIFGLWAIPHMPETISGEESKLFSQMINPLIDGVKIAMVASMLGLFFTTILSSFSYKHAKGHILNKKNEQLTHLEAELLPELYEAEDSGVSGLKTSLNDFSRKATEIVSQVNVAVRQSSENIKDQQNLIRSVDRLDVAKLSRFNLEVFGQLERNMEAFASFTSYLESMEKIAENLKHFASRSNNVDQIADKIYETLTESNELTKFLTNHFEQIERLSTNAVNAVNAAKLETDKVVNEAESHFKEITSKLEEEIDNRIQLLNIKANRDESKLTEIYEKIGEKLNRITSEHLDAFRSSYSNAVPKFEHLDNLQELPPIKENTHLLQQASYENSKRLIENLNQLNKNIEQLNSSKADQQLLQKLVDIEKKLGKNGNRKSAGNPERSPKKKGFLSRIGLKK